MLSNHQNDYSLVTWVSSTHFNFNCRKKTTNLDRFGLVQVRIVLFLEWNILDSGLIFYSKNVFNKLYIDFKKLQYTTYNYVSKF